MKNIPILGLGASALLALSLFLPDKTPTTTTQPAPQVVVSENAPSGNPEELGAVHWLRELSAGQAAAQKSDKPLLILFQEVPGCSNCTRYGNTTLSHPLIVEAIETFFVPVCIYNNKGGADAEALKQFGEPAWNNPVVRIVRADFNDLTPRMANFNSPLQLVQGMCQALERTGAVAPQYLKLLEEELAARESGLETATFSMYCFWSGEGTFGNMPGVIETEPGYQDGKEVVRVQFNPAVVRKAELEAKTVANGIQSCAKNDGFRTDREPKYYLSNTHYRSVPMTTLQACRINSMVGKNQSPESLLSPRQLALLQKIATHPDKKWPNMIGRKDLARAWNELAAM